MKNKRFWRYCEKVAGLFPKRGALNSAYGTRCVIRDIQAAAVCFDNKWSEQDCFETLWERKQTLKEVL